MGIGKFEKVREARLVSPVEAGTAAFSPRTRKLSVMGTIFAHLRDRLHLRIAASYAATDVCVPRISRRAPWFSRAVIVYVYTAVGRRAG